MERPQGWESPPRKTLELQNSLEPIILQKKTKTSVTLLCSQSKAPIGTGQYLKDLAIIQRNY